MRRIYQSHATRLRHSDSENGETLSGGERQRISIARALLKDAPVILLDEATASLDAENETKVQAGISELVRNKTVIIIAHRMRTVLGADHIVVLSGGTVVEQGTPDELLAHNGTFCTNGQDLQQDTSSANILFRNQNRNKIKGNNHENRHNGHLVGWLFHAYFFVFMNPSINFFLLASFNPL